MCVTIDCGDDVALRRGFGRRIRGWQWGYDDTWLLLTVGIVCGGDASEKLEGGMHDGGVWRCE